MSEPKTAWEQLQREAVNCPMLHKTVTIAERDGDREGAMVAALIWFSRYYKKQIDREVEMLMMSRPNALTHCPVCLELKGHGHSCNGAR